ncbi:MAG: S41 family peptidase [Bacteroidota bacterium]
MSKILKYFLFSIACITIGLLVGFKIKDSIPRGTAISLDSGARKLQRALSFIENNYVEEPNYNDLVDEAMHGMMNALDPHSTYIPASEMDLIQEDLEGAYEGIGIQFGIIEDTLYVEHPIPGGPSAELGIMPGDRIIAVDGENIAGIGISNADVTRYLKGPEGTQVQVNVLRRGVADILPFTIMRGKIPNHSVEYSYMVNDTTGYIFVTRFAETTYREFRGHLEQLLERGMTNLVLDLRGNGGGYMTMANKISDEFLSTGKLIVSTEGRLPSSDQRYKATSSIGSFENGGLVILIDYGSASASEIVSGAVQDHDRGLIVGVRSFGKGLVQYQEEFADGSAMRLVFSKYYTPSGRCIQKPYNKTREEYQDEINERFASGEIYDADKVNLPDSLKFKTMAGRTVYGGGGIYPDVFVPNDTTGASQYFMDLRLKDLPRQFAFQYVDDHPELAASYASARKFREEYTIDNVILTEFQDFAVAHGVAKKAAQFAHSRDRIALQLKALIGRRIYNNDGYYPILNAADPVFKAGLELLPVSRNLQRSGEVDLSLR